MEPSELLSSTKGGTLSVSWQGRPLQLPCPTLLPLAGQPQVPLPPPLFHCLPLLLLQVTNLLFKVKIIYTMEYLTWRNGRTPSFVGDLLAACFASVGQPYPELSAFIREPCLLGWLLLPVSDAIMSWAVSHATVAATEPLLIAVSQKLKQTNLRMEYTKTITL